VWLDFSAGFGRGAETSIKNCKVVLANKALAIRSIGYEYGANFIEISGVHRFSVEMALSKLNTHSILAPAIN
jgi:hypothetical protein